MTEPPLGPPPPPAGYGPPAHGHPAYGHPAYGPPGYYGPPRFEIGAAFSWSWAKFKANTGTLLTGGVVVLLSIVAMYAVAIAAVFAVVPDPTLTMTSRSTGEFTHVGSYFATLGVAYATIFLLAIPLSVVSAGLIRTGLRIADGESPGVGSVFSYRNAARIMLTSLVLSMASLVGLVLCYLPGLAFALFAGFTLYFLLDQGQGTVAAIKSSFALVKNNFGNALVSILLAGLVASAGLIACFIGAIFTAPFAMLVHVYTYRVLSGGTVAP